MNQEIKKEEDPPVMFLDGLQCTFDRVDVSDIFCRLFGELRKIEKTKIETIHIKNQ